MANADLWIPDPIFNIRIQTWIRIRHPRKNRTRIWIRTSRKKTGSGSEKNVVNVRGGGLDDTKREAFKKNLQVLFVRNQL